MTSPQVQTDVSRLGWLDEKHERNIELDDLWAQNEARAEGGTRVLDELWRFDWETRLDEAQSIFPAWFSKLLRIPIRPTTSRDVRGFAASASALLPGEHYARRQQSAVYVNFMDAYADDIVGHLMREAPSPQAGLSFGTMKEVRRRKDIDKPRQSELLYYNTDGVGGDGSQWDVVWAREAKAAMHTGLRWELVEMPSGTGDWREGHRPYLASFSPRLVTYPHYVNGEAQFFIIRYNSAAPRINSEGRFEQHRSEQGYYLLVREGFGDLGPEYAGGGWWTYSSDKTLLANGAWEKTEGAVPMAPLFYDRHPTLFGRPGTTELGNAGVAYMNLQSAAAFNAFDTAGGIKALAGVDEKGFNLFVDKVKNGNRWAPLPTNEESLKVPTVLDASNDGGASNIFEAQRKAIEAAVDRIQAKESSTASRSSGLAQQAGFTNGAMPRLALFAANLESCQNAVLPWFEQRFGNTETPSAEARWTRQFQLIELTSAAQAILQLGRIAGLQSTLLDTKVILAAALDQGFIGSTQESTDIEKELQAAGVVREQLAKNAALPKVPTADPSGNTPDTTGERSQNMPPEPAQTNQPIKSQIDGPAIP
ncbi:MAG: hypothetical protein H0W72_05165 [Planctomycetes bacterium]|nr:hypothetical protein [Planctomycetota bacterium]